MSFSQTKLRVLQLIIGGAGLILFTQGMSFARWNEFETLQETINDHANLLLFAGIGIFALYLESQQTSQIIAELRSKLSEVEAKVK